jgi:hypothetical protein
MVEEFVADTVVVGGGSGIRLEMHYLVAVLAVVCRPQGQARAVWIAGLREVDPDPEW